MTDAQVDCCHSAQHAEVVANLASSGARRGRASISSHSYAVLMNGIVHLLIYTTLRRVRGQEGFLRFDAGAALPALSCANPPLCGAHRRLHDRNIRPLCALTIPLRSPRPSPEEGYAMQLPPAALSTRSSSAPALDRPRSSVSWAVSRPASARINSRSNA